MRSSGDINGFPCSSEHGPIEAKVGRYWSQTFRDFRAHQSTAPLKPKGHDITTAKANLFPCSSEHGPIEACWADRLANDKKTFPCSSEHGPIEACNRMESEAKVMAFPCSSEHGPIEAGLGFGLGFGRRFDFRAHQSTAPLKLRLPCQAPI